MAAKGAAVTVGRYVRAVILNCQFVKAGAKIGKITFNILSQFFGELLFKKKCAVFTAHFLLFFFLILKSKDKDNGDNQCV